MTVSSCRGCGSSYLWTFLDLGNQALPRFPETPDEKIPHVPLELVKCEACGLVQLSESVDRDLLFRQFWYRSAVSSSISRDLRRVADAALIQAGSTGIALDIGCNDGTLLRFLPDSMTKVGFEPSLNVAIFAKQHGAILTDYFSSREYLKRFSKATLITAIAMFYDLEDPVGFCKQVSECLEPNGVFIVQQNHLGMMLSGNAYDNVCHEHVTYFSLTSLNRILAQTGLEAYNVETNEVNGGSFRAFITQTGMRPVNERVNQLLDMEKKLDLVDKKVYRDFSYRVRTGARQLNLFLADKKGVMIYGAGTRGATLLQYVAMHHPIPQIIAAVDNNPEKHGRYYLDTRIPIISRDEALKDPPDYFLVLPYHLADEIISKEREAFPSTRFIVPLPEMKVV